MPADLKPQIESNASGPKQVSGDVGSVTQHDLKDQIEAAKFLADQTAASQPNRGIRFSKLVPPGAA